MIVGANPIQRDDDDKLGRAPSAHAFARHVLALDASEGMVVGVLGAWGSGKTSFVNLARRELERAGVVVLDFNPWMFSGAEQLVDSFFVEVAAQLKLSKDLSGIGEALADYGESFAGLGWLPVVGPWIERGRGAASVLGEFLKRRKQGVGDRRMTLERALAKLKAPIVVVIDDVDRLTSAEIRDVFKLVRLTASFPNVVYVVAFDRARVEEALAEQGVPGRDYLEKILQVVHDLPVVPERVLDSQIFTAVDSSLSGIANPGRFDSEAWADVFTEIIRPLVRNMRDVRRYAVAVHGTVTSLDGQIALVDVLALEAIRVFLPGVFGQLSSAVEGLTSTDSGSLYSREPSRRKAQVDALIVAAGSRGEIVQALIRRLFPAGERHVGGTAYGSDWTGRWLRERRIAHTDVLRLYLERVVGEGLAAFADAERAWQHIGDRDALDHHLRSLDRSRVQDVVASLEAYEDQFTAEHVVPASVVLLNLLPDLPVRPRGMYELETRTVVRRVAYRLLRSLGDPATAGASVRAILPELATLSAKYELISLVGHRESVGHKLVEEVVAADVEAVWRNEVRAASADDLAKEPELLRVLYVANSERGPSEPSRTIPSEPQVTLAVLKSARSDTLSQTSGSRSVRRSPRLAWKVLVELYGDEQVLVQRIEELQAAQLTDAADLVDLAKRYASGWRPEDAEDE